MIKNIIIVGGGSAGWMAAAHMCKNLSNVTITLVESPNVPIIGVGESTVPPIVDFMKALGLEEKDWMESCSATYKSSICFSNFHGVDKNKIWFPFSGGWNAAGQPAARHWIYKYYTDSKFNDRFSIYDYCSLVPEVCRKGKTIKSLPNNPAYAYHLDAIALGEFLKKYSVERGVNHVSDTITKVMQNDDGSIKELELENGDNLGGDLFIDCSGFRSLLLGKALEEPFEDYSEYLLNDKAVVMRLPFSNKEQEMVSYTQCTALSSGWVWTIPLYDRMGNGYVYSGKFLSEDEAEAEFREHLKKKFGNKRVSEGEARHLDIRVGKHERTWVKNCVAIGLSAGFIEPLESTGLQIVQSQVHLVTETLKGRNDYNCVDVSIYNKNIRDLLDSIRDFLVTHYALTNREDSPYWREVKYNTKISDVLAEKLQFARNQMPAPGNLHKFDTGGEMAGFGFNDGWYYILMGMGHLPLMNENHKKSKVGIFDKAFENSANEADSIYEKILSEKENVKLLPSHYEVLKNSIYKGKA